jgi:pyruvate dehydrogenase E2 component (dihydrolipoamide acetyltransferase)
MSLEVIKLPDVGEPSVQIIEICVNVGDSIDVDDTLIVVETEKASMDVPSSLAGVIRGIKVNNGDMINIGDVIVELESGVGVSETPKEKIVEAEVKEVVQEKQNLEPTKSEKPQTTQEDTTSSVTSPQKVYASPSVRRMARVYGVDLSNVNPSGEKGRILKDDVQKHIKNVMSNQGSVQGGSGLNIPKAKEIDFSKFGEISIEPLTKIQKISGSNLHRNWVTIPHVTQFDECDISEIENFRQTQNALYKKQNKDVKISPIIFVLKAVAKALELYPRFNSSLSSDEQSLIYKKYINIGVAVDTPNGLVVPVIRDVNKKGIEELSVELIEFSKKARKGKLTIADMQGGCFSISSLGGIGGTMFTPIVNAPEVAILGLSKTQMKPVYNGKDFEPKLMLPLSLSYDHRVIDGADGARFISTISQLLTDIKMVLL